MPTYRQISSFRENGYGLVTIVFLVSDTYDGLYASSGVIDVGVFDLDDGSEDVDIDAGVQVENRQKITIGESTIETQQDADAAVFALDGRDASVRRFVAVHINPLDVDNLGTESLDFSGIILPQERHDDLKWSGAEYSPNQSPLRKWELEAQNFFEGIFDQVKLKGLIYGAQYPGHPDYVVGIDPAWENTVEPMGTDTHVSDRDGYYFDGDKTAKFVKIVSLNFLMRRLADNLTVTLNDRGIGSYTINLVESPLGVNFAPARFFDHGVNSRQRNANNPYRLEANDGIEPYLGDTPNLDAHLYISYATIKPEYVNSPPGSNESEYVLWNEQSTFADMLYSVAAALGCFVLFEYEAGNILSVSFLSRKSLERHEVFIRDAESASGEQNRGELADERVFYAQPHGLATEGLDDKFGMNHYNFYPKEWRYEPSELSQRLIASQPDDRVVFSVAPTMRNIAGVMTSPWSVSAIPHNCRFYDGDVPKAWELEDASGITSSLYIRRPGSSERGASSSDRLILPVAAIHATMDGVGSTHFSLTSYLQALTNRDKYFYESEQEIEVPYLCSFRKSEDGTHADDDGGRGRWQNLELGCKYRYDGADYIVVGLSRSRTEPRTKLRLHKRSRSAIDAHAGSAAELVKPSSRPAGSDLVMHEAGENIQAGCYVTKMPDGLLYKSIAHHSHYHGLLGIALNDALAGELVTVQTEGSVTHSFYELEPNKHVHIRAAGDACNLSSQALGEPNATEDLFARVGFAINYDTIRLDAPFAIIHLPKVPPLE